MRRMSSHTVLPLHVVPLSRGTSSLAIPTSLTVHPPSSVVPPLALLCAVCPHAVLPLQLIPALAPCVLSRGISSRYPSPTSRYCSLPRGSPLLAMAPLIYAHMSSHTVLPPHTVLPLHAVPLSRSTSSVAVHHFCGTATGSAMRSMSSHVVTLLQLIPALARCVLSRGISSRPPPPPPRAIPPPTARNSTPDLCARGPLTRYCLYTWYRCLAVHPLSLYPPLSQYTPLLRYRHWPCYAQYVLSRGTASTIDSRSRTVRSLSRLMCQGIQQ